MRQQNVKPTAENEGEMEVEVEVVEIQATRGRKKEEGRSQCTACPAPGAGAPPPCSSSTPLPRPPTCKHTPSVHSHRQHSPPPRPTNAAVVLAQLHPLPPAMPLPLPMLTPYPRRLIPQPPSPPLLSTLRLRTPRPPMSCPPTPHPLMPHPPTPRPPTAFPPSASPSTGTHSTGARSPSPNMAHWGTISLAWAPCSTMLTGAEAAAQPDAAPVSAHSAAARAGGLASPQSPHCSYRTTTTTQRSPSSPRP